MFLGMIINQKHCIIFKFLAFRYIFITKRCIFIQTTNSNFWNKIRIYVVPRILEMPAKKGSRKANSLAGNNWLQIEEGIG